jgi:hypothetical protein
MQSQSGYSPQSILDFLNPKLAESSPSPLLGDLRVQSELRSYVDEWIDSGIQADGSEHRMERKLRRNSQLLEAVTAFIAAHPPSATICRDGSGLDSSFSIRPRMSPREKAMCFFLTFFGTPQRFDLMRCHSCRRLQLPSAPAPRNRYEVGWFCNRCGRTRAKAITTKKRKKDDDKVNLRAAEALRKWVPKNGEKVSWVTTQVNKGVRYDLRTRPATIRSRWSTIEALAKEPVPLIDPAVERLRALEASGAFDEILITQEGAPPLYVLRKEQDGYSDQDVIAALEIRRNRATR